jgi:hypothetical protein
MIAKAVRYLSGRGARGSSKALFLISNPSLFLRQPVFRAGQRLPNYRRRTAAVDLKPTGMIRPFSPSRMIEQTWQAIREGQITGLAIVSIALVATREVPANAHPPCLIYNASGSAQLGFHEVENRTPSRRNMVVVRSSVTLENLVANHGVLPRGILFGSR